MKILFNSALMILIVTFLAHTQEGQVRLSPVEISTLVSTDAEVGTSGVSEIQTRTLKGDATKPGIYTIQLTIPSNVTIQARTHPMIVWLPLSQERGTSATALSLTKQS